MDEQTEVTEETTPSSPFDEVEDTIRSNYERLVNDVAGLRKERSTINDRIRVKVEQLRKAERLVRALEPKRRKT